MSSYLVTGAGRGLGLELTKQLLGLPATQVSKVFALTRAAPSTELQHLLDQHSDRADNIIAATNDKTAVTQAVNKVESALAGKGLDVLINNAGISRHNSTGMHNVPTELMSETFDVNVIGVQIVTSAFLQLLKKGKDKKVINISSTLGAISWVDKFQLSPTHAYKISKAALNMMTQLYALDLAGEGFTFLSVSPGWLKTDLGSQAADLEVPVGAKEVIRITQEATTAQNGKFLNIHVPGWEQAHGKYDGEEISW